MEEDGFKCLQYWLNDIDKPCIYGKMGQFGVTLIDSEERDSYIERNLNVLQMVIILDILD